MKTADIHSQLQALISACIDEGDYDPSEDYINDPFCRRTMHTASLAINEIDTLRARVAELEADRDSWRLLGVEVKDMIGRLDAGGQLTKQDIECLRALVYRADVRTGEVGNG